MNLSAHWQNLLTAAWGVRKYMLLTLSLSGDDPGPDAPHLATHVGALCYATDINANVTTAAGTTIPFLPFLETWPKITRELYPQERRASIADVTVSILPMSGLAAILRDRGSAAGMTFRLDLWAPFVTLEDAIPRMAGRVTAAEVNRQTGAVSLTLTDGDPSATVPYPQGMITREDFPDAPDGTADVWSRQSVLGEYSGDVPCPQIDADRRVFYVADPPVEIGGVKKGGELLAMGWTARTLTTETGWQYTAIVFDSPVSEIAAGLTDDIAATGVVGSTAKDPISFFLDVAQVPISTASKGLLANFFAVRTNHMPVLIDAQGNALDIARTRLIPQTPFAFSMHRGQAELINLFDWTSDQQIGLGNGLIFRLAAQDKETAPESVYNAFEFTCGSEGTKILRDAEHGPQEMRALCQRSLAASGGRRRYLAVSLPDVALQYEGERLKYPGVSPSRVPHSTATDAGPTVIGCALGQLLADGAVRLHASAHTPHAYQATWLHGLGLELGQRMLLTDPADETLNDTAVVVTKIVDAPTGPQITFQTQDASV